MATSGHEKQTPDENPPGYDTLDPNQDPNTNANTTPGTGLLLRPLNLDPPTDPKHIATQTVTTDECIAHLKLLAVFSDLRDKISRTDGIFNLYDALAENFAAEESRLKALALVRERRWAIYVNRAVERFTVWFDRCIPVDGPGSNGGRTTMWDIEEGGCYHTFPEWVSRITWRTDTMPPLDVLMVWHSYLLNPWCCLEDSLRLGKMSFWAAGFPWGIVNACISDSNLEYGPGDSAKEIFRSATGLPWDNLDGNPYKMLSCPRCQSYFNAPWTDAYPSIEPLDSPFSSGKGYADKGFHYICQTCNFEINHDVYRVAKFRHDIQGLVNGKALMPGTLLSKEGVPTGVKSSHSVLFPNNLIAKALYDELITLTDPRNGPPATMSQVRDMLDSSQGSRSRISKANGSRFCVVYPAETTALRRMLARYWENSSPFALDLVGAVIRQGVFVDKMDNIDWLHSPALEATMTRLIEKYHVFFQILSEQQLHMAVPTLDVDLAWHTHQLSPSRYFAFSVARTGGRFINHDDKIKDSALSEGFEWTARQYQKLTGGKPYSECTCWYCEAVREPHIHGLFSSSTARNNAAQLHSQPGVMADPERNPHISAHNSIVSESERDVQLRDIKISQLRRRHEKARKRARNKGESKDIPAHYMAWGVPLPVPYYPFAADPCINGDLYPANPACISGGDGIDVSHGGSGVTGGCISGPCGGHAGCGGGGGGASGGGCGSSSGGSGGGGGCGGGGGGGGSC